MFHSYQEIQKTKNRLRRSTNSGILVARTKRKAGFDEGLGSLNKSWDKFKFAVRNKASRYTAGSYFGLSMITLRNFDDTILTKLPKDFDETMRGTMHARY